MNYAKIQKNIKIDSTWNFIENFCKNEYQNVDKPIKICYDVRNEGTVHSYNRSIHPYNESSFLEISSNRPIKIIKMYEWEVDGSTYRSNSTVRSRKYKEEVLKKWDEIKIKIELELKKFN